MKDRIRVFALLVAMLAMVQSVWAQGFRVYKSDGSYAQYSTKADSIVFYDNLGDEVEMGPNTPVNAMMAGVWRTLSGSQLTLTLGEDGSAALSGNSSVARYEYYPYSRDLVLLDGQGEVSLAYHVFKMTDTYVVLSQWGSSTFTNCYSGTDPFNGHEWVDLGLPSGLKWATCNIGAEKPEDYGWYLAWGETEEKSSYNWSTYKWCNGSSSKMTKYSQSTNYWDSSLGTSPDQKTVLDPEDDAAHVNWGGSWRMPTYAELTELRNKCTWTWGRKNGVNGYTVRGPNGYSIFLPASGYRDDNSSSGVGSYGYYWSSTLCMDGSYSDGSYCLYFRSGYQDWLSYSRSNGRSVRAVCP